MYFTSLKTINQTETPVSVILLAYQATLEQVDVKLKARVYWRRGVQNLKLVRVQTKNFQSIVLYNPDKSERYHSIMNIHASDKAKELCRSKSWRYNSNVTVLR